MDTKLCTRCHKQKPISEFYVSTDGRVRNWCHDCNLAYRTELKLKNKIRQMLISGKNHKEMIELTGATKEHIAKILSTLPKRGTLLIKEMLKKRGHPLKTVIKN